MGWERSIMPGLARLIDAFPKGFPESLEVPFDQALAFGPDRQKHKALSPNHWAMGINRELLRAAAYGSTKEYDRAREIVLRYLEIELEEQGFWQGEQYTGDPHGGFHMAAMFAGAMASKERLDAELAAIQFEHRRRLFAYMAATAAPDGEVICCGERMPKGPGAVQQSAVYREAAGLPHPNRKKIDKQISDDFWASLRAFRALRDSGMKVEVIMPDEMPFTKEAIEVVRWKGGHQARYLGGGGDGTCSWVRAEYLGKGNLVEWRTAGTPAPEPEPGRSIRTARRNRDPKPPKEEVPMEMNLPGLWPKAPFIPDKLPRAEKDAAAVYGPGLDLGATRFSGDHWEILVKRTPTATDPTESRWITYEGTFQHHLWASCYNRYGQGWSKGGVVPHSDAIRAFRAVNGRDPVEMERRDIEYNRSAYDSLLAQNPDGKPPVITPEPPKRPAPPVTPPATPPVQPPVQPPAAIALSPAEQRAEELRAMVRNLLDGGSDPVKIYPLVWALTDQRWPLTKPFFVEALKFYRLLRRKLGDERPLPQ